MTTGRIFSGRIGGIEVAANHNRVEVDLIIPPAIRAKSGEIPTSM